MIKHFLSGDKCFRAKKKGALLIQNYKVQFSFTNDNNLEENQLDPFGSAKALREKNLIFLNLNS